MAERSSHSTDGKFLSGFPHGTGRQHHPSWTDSFPQTFHGWGPQTPDRDEDEHAHFRAPESDLRWPGRGDHDDHIVWRFERKVH